MTGKEPPLSSHIPARYVTDVCCEAVNSEKMHEWFHLSKSDAYKWIVKHLKDIMEVNKYSIDVH